MSRGGLRGLNRTQFETHSVRRTLAPGREDRTLTAMSYLEGRYQEAAEITVITLAHFLRLLGEASELSAPSGG